MASEVSICNDALRRLGQSRIASFSEESTEAQTCSQVYDDTRKRMLVSAPWRFATEISALAATDETSELGYSYVYTMPAGWLQPLTIVGSGAAASSVAMPIRDTSVQYEVVGDRLHTHVVEARLKYIQDITEVAKFDVAFRDALAWAIAGEIAMVITDDSSQRDRCWQMAMMVAGQAAALSGNQSRLPQYTEGAFLDSRKGVCGSLGGGSAWEAYPSGISIV